MKPVIRCENLGKCYHIGQGPRGAAYRTLRESLTDLAGRAVRRWRGGGGPEGARPFWALKDVSFEVRPGEVVGVIGRNGAGKSTLLKILSRITKPSRGAAVLHGRVGSLLEVGTGFHPELTGRENIYLNGAILGMSRREIAHKFDDITAFAEIDRFLDTPVKRYSSGMYVRLAFAVAAHLESEILLVDEVLAVGDLSFQQKCLGKMHEIGSSGRTVVFVSHNLAALQQLCQRALLVRAGTLAEEGPADLVISSYLRDAQTSVQGVFDLSHHAARSPGHRPILKALAISSSQGLRTDQYYPDDPLIAELTIDPPAPIKSPRIALAIEDGLGRRITTVASYFQAQPLPDIDGPCRVKCRLPRLELGSGRYLLSISIGDPYNGLLDSLDNAAWFEVGWRNNYGNGEAFQRVYGPVLKPSTWEFVEKNDGRACCSGPNPLEEHR